jgi:hypothetical protein
MVKYGVWIILNHGPDSRSRYWEGWLNHGGSWEEPPLLFKTRKEAEQKGWGNTPCVVKQYIPKNEHD